jgi:hypothetical protein
VLSRHQRERQHRHRLRERQHACVHRFPEEIREMKDPTQWPRVVNIIYGIIVPVYLFSAVAGYGAYGGYSQANLNLNFPSAPLPPFPPCALKGISCLHMGHVPTGY